MFCDESTAVGSRELLEPLDAPADHVEERRAHRREVVGDPWLVPKAGVALRPVVLHDPAGNVLEIADGDLWPES